MTGQRVTAVTTADGHTRRYLIDERCRVVAEIDPLGAGRRHPIIGPQVDPKLGHLPGAELK
ncbi:hypothetical protein ACFWG0_02290 [Streptomyces yangpuensis]|uniref:hypothetical protein n=1 Tax=Streptomyces yangpuensis TaxID=1648182 RepID=UPI00365F9851